MTSMEETPFRLLVVDDDQRLLKTFKRWLCRRGLDAVLVADNAAATAALEASARRECFFDLVLRDYHLQDELGIDLITAIKRWHPAATIAVVSSFLDARVSVEVSFLCDFTVSKPVDEESLGLMLEQVKQARCEQDDHLMTFCKTARLSPRESSVVECAVKHGHNAKQLADLFGCTESTIYTYWHRIFIKTSCSSQRDVMALLARQISRKF
jgi:DNA-binding NarL/FixJ family response regulator